MFGFEIEFLKFLEGIRTDFLNKIFELVTMIGEDVVVIVVIAIIYFIIDKKLAQKILYTTAISMGVNGVIKNLVKIPRPWTTGEVTCVRESTATGYSFPSGHTQTISTYASAFAINLKKKWFSILSVIIIILVAFSRMYLGAHYPSDVIVGALLGVGFAFLGNFLYDKVANKKSLLLYTCLAYIPFVIFFLFNADEHSADFYKMYGLLAGFSLSVLFEDCFVNFSNEGLLWKKIIKTIIALLVALGIKSGVKVLFGLLPFADITWCLLLLDAIRYCILAFVCLGGLPYIYKKLKL